MKIFINPMLVLLFIFFSTDGMSKSKHRSYSRRNVDKNGYIGVSYGAAIPIGKFSENESTGISSSIDFGYAFRNNVGIVANIFSTNQNFTTINESASLIKIGILVGPSYRIKINNKLNWDIKATVGYVATDSVSIVATNKPEVVGTGLAFDLGTSIRFNWWKNLYLGLNLDYLVCMPKYEGVLRNVSDATVGIGLGWTLK